MRIAAAIVTLASIFFFAPWEYALYYLSPVPDSIQAQADEAVTQGVDGIIVYVHTKGQEPEFYASGWHDRKKLIPADPNALFKIASIGKLYDASAVTKLVASKALSLDRTLADYLPSVASRIENAETITLRMMVQHRSGIPNFTDQEEFNWGESSLDVLAMVLDKPAQFEPDSDYRYSNTNYLLLQKIMSKVLGYHYWQYIQAELLTPLALNRTYESINSVDIDALMSGYYVGYDHDFKTLDQGYIATAEDVGIFIRALNDGTLLSPKEQEIYASLYEFEHTGWVIGYLSVARYHQDLDTVIIQFINTNGNDTVMLRDIIYGRIVQIIKTRN